MSQDLNGKTYSFDVCGKCKIICCQDANPPLTQKRMKIIQDYLDKNGISIKNPFTKKKYFHPSTDENGVCVFLEKKQNYAEYTL
jgi:hypothetical protein